MTVPTAPRFLTAADVAAELRISRTRAELLIRGVSGEPTCTREQFAAYLDAATVYPEGSCSPLPETGLDHETSVVYFVQSGKDGPVKIGWTRCLRERLCRLQMGNPVELRVVAWWPGGPRDEAWLHHRFRDQHIRGEWFQLTPELLAAARSGQ